MFALFNSVRSPFPRHNIDYGQLQWALREDPRLQQLTQSVRIGTGARKLDLGAVSLGGTFQSLPAHVHHGHCIPAHRPDNCHGYRNTQHVDWSSRTGLVLLDLDGVVDPRWFQVYLQYGVPAVACCWVSASGGGLKAGVLVTPLPTDPADQHDAWAAAYAHVVDALRRAGMREREHYSVDITPAAAQAAIMAHDPDAFARPATEAVVWTPGYRVEIEGSGLYHPNQNSSVFAPAQTDARAGLAECYSPTGVASLLSWNKGSRTTSMFHFGIMCASKGFDWRESRETARGIALGTGLAAKNGMETALRHFERGWRNTEAELVEWWNVS